MNPYGSKYVAGEGPSDARCMLIGEGPGYTENLLGRPFVGRTGELLNRMLTMEGICREEIYITNVVKFRVPNDGDPTAEDLKRDAGDLREELRAVRPEIVGLLGAVAVKVFMGKDVSLEWSHGLPFRYKSFKGSKVNYRSVSNSIFLPCYHPALGLHALDMLPQVEGDIKQFARLVKGQMSEEELRGRRDEHPRTRYLELTNVHAKRIESLLCDEDACLSPLAVDTEGWWYKPWGLSFSQIPGIAYVIRAKQKKAVAAFARGLKRSGRLVILHNSMHDLEVLSALGITDFPFIDTMLSAYHLATEPQGLKPLVRRYCGMRQDSYEDVIGAASKRKALEYLRKVERWAVTHEHANRNG